MMTSTTLVALRSLTVTIRILKLPSKQRDLTRIPDHQPSSSSAVVIAHENRAFAASKAFQSGVSLEQLPAYHWKSHKPFMQFYFRDVAWADSEIFHLDPVVAAQQIHH